MTMLTTVPFRSNHIDEMVMQPRQSMLAHYFDSTHFKSAENDRAFTGYIDGVIMGSAGVLPQWPGRALCWAVLSDQVRPNHFMAIHRNVKEALAAAHDSGFGRIETTVAVDWPAAMRWTEALGFQREAYMKQYAPGGGDTWLMVKFDER